MKKSRYTGLYVVMVILVILPFILPNSFYMDLAIRMAINAVIVLGLNLLIGFAGQISLGHAGFIGIGAYASAVLPAPSPPACWRPSWPGQFSSLRGTTWPWPHSDWGSSSTSRSAPRPR